METTSESTIPTDSSPEASLPTALLRGASVAPGMTFGRAIFREHDLDSIPVRRVPQDGVEAELNRLRAGLETSTQQLLELRDRLRASAVSDQLSLIDGQIDRLKDSVFLADVENLILGEQMGLEGAIAKVILDFDRIARLVENDVLRERARELRDVGMRVLRNLEAEGLEEAAPGRSGAGGSAAGKSGATTAPSPSREEAQTQGILIARELTVSEVIGLAGGEIRGVVTVEGSLTGQAAVFLRSLRIPALTGVDDLFDRVQPGDDLLLDASEGCLHVRPDRRLLDQFEVDDAERADAEAKALSQEVTSHDGEPVQLSAACGNLPEVDSAHSLGLQGVGLYRTELLFLLERNAPGVHTLEAHYRSVLKAAQGSQVVFRLADIDSSMEVPYMHSEREANPALGSAGIRALLDAPVVLRRQLEGILRATSDYDGEVGIALPRVTDVSELRAVRELLFEERYALKREQQAYREHIHVGVIFETPASVLGCRDFAEEADFLAVGLDSLQQYLLAADRDEPRMAAQFEVLHPFVLRALEQIVQAAAERSTSLRVYGVSVGRPDNVALLLAAGFRHLCVSPASALQVERQIRECSIKESRPAAERWAGLSAPDTWDAS